MGKKLLRGKIIVSISAVSLIILLTGGLLGVLSGSLIGSTSANCGNSKSGKISQANGEQNELSVTEEQEQNAKKIRAVLTEFGLDDNKVFGAIGNAQQESSLLAPFTELTGLWNHWKEANNTQEGIEVVQKYGTKAEDIFVNGWNSVVSAYASSSVGPLAENGYRGGSPDGSHWVGFGIWQWTGYNGVMPYFDWADDNNLTRADIDNILTFAVSDSSSYFEKYTAEGDFYYRRLQRIKDMPDAGSPAEGANIWFNYYEYEAGGALSAEGGRTQYATDWAVRLGKEEIDKDYAKSILSKANTVSAQSNNSKNKSSCSSKSSSSKGKGGHPYNHDYDLTAAFHYYNKARTISASNLGFFTHNGIDLVADYANLGFNPKGDLGEIYAVLGGKVIRKNPGSGTILIKSEPSETDLDKPVVLEYTHMVIDSAFDNLQVGDEVKAGDRVGTEGDTFSPPIVHLHFGVLNAEAVENGVDLWSGVNLDPKNYGGSVDDLIIDPGLVLEGIEVGWFDTESDNYLGDEFIQPTPLRIRVDGTTADDPRIAGKKK